MSGGSTKSLRSHLERKHRNEWQDKKRRGGGQGERSGREAEEVEGAAWSDHAQGKSRQELQGRPTGCLAKEV